jgi:hypothetical protein
MSSLRLSSSSTDDARTLSVSAAFVFAIVRMSILRLSCSSTDDARDLAVSAAFVFAIVRMPTLILFGSFTDNARDLPVSAAFFFFFSEQDAGSEEDGRSEGEEDGRSEAYGNRNQTVSPQIRYILENHVNYR